MCSSPVKIRSSCQGSVAISSAGEPVAREGRHRSAGGGRFNFITRGKPVERVYRPPGPRRPTVRRAKYGSHRAPTFTVRSERWLTSRGPSFYGEVGRGVAAEIGPCRSRGPFAFGARCATAQGRGPFNSDAAAGCDTPICNCRGAARLAAARRRRQVGRGLRKRRDRWRAPSSLYGPQMISDRKSPGSYGTRRRNAESTAKWMDVVLKRRYATGECGLEGR
ncbi:unnamed protein product, partial [Iphiclides podalirius]